MPAPPTPRRRRNTAKQQVVLEVLGGSDKFRSAQQLYLQSARTVSAYRPDQRLSHPAWPCRRADRRNPTCRRRRNPVPPAQLARTPALPAVPAMRLRRRIHLLRPRRPHRRSHPTAPLQPRSPTTSICMASARNVAPNSSPLPATSRTTAGGMRNPGRMLYGHSETIPIFIKFVGGTSHDHVLPPPDRRRRRRSGRNHPYVGCMQLHPVVDGPSSAGRLPSTAARRADQRGGEHQRLG